MLQLYTLYIDPTIKISLNRLGSWQISNNLEIADALLVSSRNSKIDWLQRLHSKHPLIPIVFLGESQQIYEFCCPSPSQSALLPILSQLESIVDAIAQLPLQTLEKICNDIYLRTAAFLWSRNKRIDMEFSINHPHGYGYRCDEVINEAETIFTSMAASGYLDKELADAVHPCPRCRDIRILIRDTCSECHSIAIQEETLVHHFSCSYQGAETSFLDEMGQYICPKCRRQLRHLGMDYDKPGSLMVCHQCGHQASETHVRGRCIACSHDFAIEQSPRKELYHYILNEKGIDAFVSGKAAESGARAVLITAGGFGDPRIINPGRAQICSTRTKT